jgi:hypothetical protein
MTSLTTIKEVGELAEEVIRLFAKKRNLGNKKFTLKEASYLVVERNRDCCFVDGQTVYETAIGLCTIRRRERKEKAKQEEEYQYSESKIPKKGHWSACPND